MKVVVGLSGGVDSSVSAYLLKKQGYEVIGVFMQNWDSALNNDLADPLLNEEKCQASIDYEDAKKVAEKIGIPIYRVNFVEEYWNDVFKKFLEDYKNGLTPNPDVFCNKYIKFKAFLDYAKKEFDCDYIAMGHYAQVIHGEKIRMLRGIDENKDQTYFLEQLNKEQLENTLFPIGHLTKNEVREIAKEQGLITYNKKDSTGICFIGDRKFQDFLKNYLKESQGNFVDVVSQKIVQPHKGLMYYTIGQRNGLGIGGNKNFANKKWYVVGKNLEENIVYVAQDDENYYLKSNNAIIKNVNYLGYNGDVIKTVKFRYRSLDVKINKYSFLDENTLYIEYDPVLAVTPGQACVFYQDEICLGGGEIKSVKYNDENRAFFTKNDFKEDEC